MPRCPVCGSPVDEHDAVCRTCGAALAPSSTLAPGTVLRGGQYVIRRVLGQGGFGVTYEAFDGQFGRKVAIKELFVDGSTRRGGTVYPPASLRAQEFGEVRSRFLDEARALARFTHPNIVRVWSYFEENGTAYLVMEYLEGETLGARIAREGALPSPLVESVARTCASTLAAVHRAGLLHRDIKPDNIFLERGGRVVLIDFGSTRAYAPGKTVSHTRLVTPGYAPLEQYGTAAKFGPYTDVYALGATLYHAVTGKMPPAATDLAQGVGLPPLPTRTPPALRQAIEQAMRVRIDERPASADALLALLTSGGAAGTPASTTAPARSTPPTPPAAARAAPQQPAPQRPVPQRPVQPAAPRPAPPAPVATPVDPFQSYLNRNNLNLDGLLQALHDGSLRPAQLPAVVRDTLIGSGVLNADGSVRAARRPAGGPPGSSGQDPKATRRAVLAQRRFIFSAVMAVVLAGALGVTVGPVGVLGGAVAGFVLGVLVWSLLPALPLVAGGAACYFYLSGQLPRDSALMAGAAAVLVSFVLVQALRR